MLCHMLATTDIAIGGFKWKGEFTAIDLIAAGTNALNGALLSDALTTIGTSRWWGS